MGTIRTTDPTNNVVLTQWGAFIDGPTGNGTIDVYEGPPAASRGAAPSGTLLGTLTHGRPAYQTPSGGNLDAYPITSETNAVAGTIGCLLFRNSSGTIVGDATASYVGGGGSFEFGTTNPSSIVLANGDTIAMSSLRINLG